jgi:hypothetical protein
MLNPQIDILFLTSNVEALNISETPNVVPADIVFLDTINFKITKFDCVV